MPKKKKKADTGSQHVAQAGLELQDSSSSPALVLLSRGDSRYRLQCQALNFNF